MSEAVEKTALLVRVDVPINSLVPNPANPNVMHDAEFNLLCENMSRMGFTDAVLVREIGDGKYRIVGGHHRWEAAKFLGFEMIPVVINRDPLFDEEQEEFQLVRHNVIHGQLSPTKFLELYAKYAKKYSEEILQDQFGFADREEFKKLIEQTRQTLPKQMRSKFNEAVKDVKTISGLAKILNQLFTQYRDTLPWNYMVFDYAGKQSLWIRCHPDQLEGMQKLGEFCMKSGITLDAALGWMVRFLSTQETVLAQLKEQVPQNAQVLVVGTMPVEDPLNTAFTS